MDASPISCFRVYSCSIEGVLHRQELPYGGVQGRALDAEMNRRFHAWLESIAPGAFRRGMVTGIRFEDITR